MLVGVEIASGSGICVDKIHVSIHVGQDALAVVAFA